MIGSGHSQEPQVIRAHALREMQCAVHRGELPRLAAIADVRAVFGFSASEAAELFPAEPPAKAPPAGLAESVRGVIREAVRSELRQAIRESAEWDETRHPRASDGRFGDKAGDHGAGKAGEGQPGAGKPDHAKALSDWKARGEARRARRGHAGRAADVASAAEERTNELIDRLAGLADLSGTPEQARELAGQVAAGLGHPETIGALRSAGADPRKLERLEKAAGRHRAALERALGGYVRKLEAAHAAGAKAEAARAALGPEPQPEDIGAHQAVLDDPDIELDDPRWLEAAAAAEAAEARHERALDAWNRRDEKVNDLTLSAEKAVDAAHDAADKLWEAWHAADVGSDAADLAAETADAIDAEEEADEEPEEPEGADDQGDDEDER